MDREKVIKEFEAFVNGNCPSDSKHVCHMELMETVLALLKEQKETISELQNAYGYLQKQYFKAQDKLLKKQESKQYNRHEVACILADLFGDPCACHYYDIDTWLGDKCDFRETSCPKPVGVACWEQFLKHRKGR